MLAFIGTAAMQNGPLWWASWHRHHHKHADTELDAHSPRRSGFWHAHLGWVLDGSHDEPNLANVRDLSRFPELRFLDRHKWLPLVAYAVACFAVAGWPGVVWGFVVSTVLVFHATCLINSLAHVWGRRRYATADDSRNNTLLALLTMGEGWHNNHHHDMSSARQGVTWWEVDITYYIIKLLERVGIVWSVRARNRASGAARRRRAAVIPALKKALSPTQLAEIDVRFEAVDHKTFGKDGFDEAVQQVPAIEHALGLVPGTPTAPPAPKS